MTISVEKSHLLNASMTTKLATILLCFFLLPIIGNAQGLFDGAKVEMDSSILVESGIKAATIPAAFVSATQIILDPQYSNEDKRYARLAIQSLFADSSKTTIIDFIKNDVRQHYTPYDYGRDLNYIQNYREYYQKEFKLAKIDTVDFKRGAWTDGGYIYRGEFYVLEVLSASKPVRNSHYVYTDEYLRIIPFTLRPNKDGQYFLRLETLKIIDKRNEKYKEISRRIKKENTDWHIASFGDLPVVIDNSPRFNDFDCVYGEDFIKYYSRDTIIHIYENVIFSMNNKESFWYIEELGIIEEGETFEYKFREPGIYTVKAVTKKENYCDVIKIKVHCAKSPYKSPTVADYLVPGLGHRNYGRYDVERYSKVGIYGGLFIASAVYASVNKVEANRNYKRYMNANTIEDQAIYHSKATIHHRQFIIGAGAAALTWIASASHVGISHSIQNKYFEGSRKCKRAVRDELKLELEPALSEDTGIGLSLKMKF